MLPDSDVQLRRTQDPPLPQLLHRRMLASGLDGTRTLAVFPKEETMAESMTADDFVTGIFAVLAVQGHRVLDGVDRLFDESMAEAYRFLVDEYADASLDVDFQVNPDPLHGDSTVIQDALMVAIQSRVVARINPTFRRVRIILPPERAQGLLNKNLPGGMSLYEKLAEKFLHHYMAAV